jgi:8-oxo-dGTP pyrophosphatase MutT (NUDIX family)
MKRVGPLKQSSSKEVSVLAWVEDPFGRVLMVRQTKGPRSWTFPGGKVQKSENLITALRRELREEIGLDAVTAAPLDIYDRAERGAIAILFRVLLEEGSYRVDQGEIESFAVRKRLPSNSTPSARYFWKRAQKCFDPLSLFWLDRP